MTKRTLKKVRNSINRHNRRVREKNDAFEDMTKAQQRVQLANDVVKQIKAARLIPTSGTWLSREINGDRKRPLLAQSEIDDNLQMNKLLPQIERCNVCAVGALLYCTVMRSNALTVGEIRQRSTDTGLTISDFPRIKAYLSKYFSENQIDMMEAAFEKKNDPEDQTTSVTAAGRMFMKREYSADYGWSWEEREEVDDETRLVVIMENVAKNGGTFKPERYHA